MATPTAGDPTPQDATKGAISVKKWLDRVFPNEKCLQYDYQLRVHIEDSSHPLISDKLKENVCSFVVPQSMAGPDGNIATGALYIMADTATSFLTTFLDPARRNNVTLSLDLKRVAPIPVGKKLFMKTLQVVHNKKYVCAKYEFYDEQHKLLCEGYHTKVYIKLPFQKL